MAMVSVYSSEESSDRGGGGGAEATSGVGVAVASPSRAVLARGVSSGAGLAAGGPTGADIAGGSLLLVRCHPPSWKRIRMRKA